MRRRRLQYRRPQLPLLLCCNALILMLSCLVNNKVSLDYLSAVAPLLLPIVTAQNEDPSADYSCGTDWVNAANACAKHCPSGSDDECNELGDNYGCYYFTGCKPRFEELQKEQEEQEALEDADEEEVIIEIPPEDNQFCAPTFIEAMLECPKEKKCPIGNECGVGEICFGNTNCDRELKDPVSDIIFTLKGPDDIMEDEDITIFREVIFEILASIFADLKVHLEEMTVIDQRYFTDNESVEVSVIFNTKYRPPPRHKIDSIVENSINLQKDFVKAEIKKAGNEVRRWYFSKLEEISAVSRENATKRPTVSPTGGPTFTPTDVPSSYPSASPSASPTSTPSDMPSSSPSRMHVQDVVTAPSNELKSSTETSYGVVFNVRTAFNGPVVLVTGLDFYTESAENVGYELWSRLGSFKDFKGAYDGWDLIAAGVVKGAGYAKLTSIPSATFTQVSIPGRGATRAFYLTLNSMDLNYGESEESGISDTKVVASSPDLSIYEGEAVLAYPFPDPSQQYLYRSPRRFLGAVIYDRLPCKPFSLYGPVMDLPCADIPTVSPTTKRPTPKPTTGSPTKAPISLAPTVDFNTISDPSALAPPTMSPLIEPSLSPSVSNAPSISTSPTLYPTASPVIPIRAYIVATLRNTLNRDMSDAESEAFFDIFVPFMREHCKRAMMIENIDLWSEEQITVDAPFLPNANNTMADAAITARATEGRRMVQATRLTLVLQISSTTLPLNLLGSMASVAIEENQAELITEISTIGETYDFFANVDQVVSYVIDGVTEAPVSSPVGNKMTSQEWSDGSNTEDAPVQIGVVIGATVAILWILLAMFSIGYLTKVRSKMNAKRDSEKRAKIDPLTGTESDNSDRSDFDGGRRIGLTKIGVAKSLALQDRFPRNGREAGLSRSMPILTREAGARYNLGLDLDGSGYSSIDLDDLEFGLSNNELNPRGSMRRSDSQGDLRASLRRTGSSSNLRGSMRRSDSQGDLRGSLRRTDSASNLRSSMRGSMRRSDSQGDLRGSLRRTDSASNLRSSVRGSMRLSDSQGDLRGSIRRTDSASNLRSSMRNSEYKGLRLSGNDGNLRGSGNKGLRLSGNDGNLRGSGNKGLRLSGNDDNLRGSGNKGLRLSGNDGNLRGSGNKGLRGSDNDGNLRGSGNKGLRLSGNDGNLRGSGNKGLRLSGNDGNLRGSGNKSRVGSSNADLSKSMNMQVTWDIEENLMGKDDDTNGLSRSDGDIVADIGPFKGVDKTLRRNNRSSDDLGGKLRRSTIDLPGEKGNDNALRRSGNTQTLRRNNRSSDDLRKLRRSTIDLPGKNGNDNALRRSGNKQSRVARTSNDNLRSSGGRGALSKSMTSVRASDKFVSTRRLTVDNERPASRLRSSGTGNERRGSRLRTSITDQNNRTNNNLRSSTRNDRPQNNKRSDSRLRSSSIEQRNHASLSSSTKGDRTRSQSVRLSNSRDKNADTEGDGSNFSNLVRQASARRDRRRYLGETNNDISALKKNLIL